ncbi:hypothetical protein KUCAC02_001843, partial [Chaenocephalus aceratus]
PAPYFTAQRLCIQFPPIVSIERPPDPITQPHLWDLFTVGRGTDRKKINLGQEWAVKERGGAKRGRKESVQGSSSVGPRQGPRVPPSVICLHTQKISDNFTAPLSVAIEKGQIPSWLLTLYPPQCKQQIRVMPVKSVCA